MSDELFAEVKGEGATLDIDKSFERLATKGEESSESQPEKNTASASQKAEESTTAEDKTPFHKHPRWIKTQETLNEYKTRIADFEKKFADLEKNTKQVELPEWWKKQYGETEESKTQYSQYETATQAERDRLKADIKADLQNETKQDESQIADANKFVDEQMQEMADEGLKFDRNSLLKFMVDFQKEYGDGSLMTDGNYDFRKALALKERMEPEATDNTDTKKQLAANAGRSKVQAGSASKIPVISTRSLRKGGWREAGI